ncbi:hypothetical protein M378DRAFT_174359 [Amanita muscaria Koide BX008]|uniref:Uncharacterized protein n=1 Tax=Amanita muscaria (strain Koide BX008) TaxID=946122 RepID=A0A0C2WDV3_AMAMK|nr:hypothetical protein M378DRAFT_174359 [Amanita muscaria Koide BX008]
MFSEKNMVPAERTDGCALFKLQASSLNMMEGFLLIQICYGCLDWGVFYVRVRPFLTSSESSPLSHALQPLPKRLNIS